VDKVRGKDGGYGGQDSSPVLPDSARTTAGFAATAWPLPAVTAAYKTTFSVTVAVWKASGLLAAKRRLRHGRQHQEYDPGAHNPGTPNRARITFGFVSIPLPIL